MSPWGWSLAACVGLAALVSGCLHLPSPVVAKPAEEARADTRSPALAGDWHPVATVPMPFVGLPAGLPVAGLGAKRSPRGLLARRCLSKVESSTAGGGFSVEVHPVSGRFLSGDPDVDAFVEGSARRAAEAHPTPGRVSPVAALLVVRTTGQWTAVDEASATLAEPAIRLLEEGRDWDFFERCGTHYVQAVRREVSALVFIALHPASAARRADLESRLARRAGKARDDLLTLRVLDELLEGVPSFLAVHADADAAFDVVELGLRGPEVGRAGRLVGQALRASFGAERGRVLDVTLRPWFSLPAVMGRWRGLRQELAGEPERRERLFQQLKLLEGRALDWEALLARVRAGAAVPWADACGAALTRALAPFAWEAYYGCREAAWDTLPAALGELEACGPVLAAVGRDRPPEACELLALDDEGGARYPLVLAPGGRLGLLHRAGLGAYLYTDEAQFASAPAPVAVGTQTDRRGTAFPSLCVRRGRDETSAGGEGVPTEESFRPPRAWRAGDWDTLYLRGTPPALVEPHDADPPAEAPPEAEEDAAGPICIQPRGAEGRALLCLREKGEAEAPSDAPVPGAFGAEAPARAGVSPAKPAVAPEARARGGAGEPREVVLGVSANYRLDGERRRPWWKRLVYSVLLSWREPTPARPIYRGAYEARSLKSAGAEERLLTEEAAALARQDLAAFYRACGTHLVSQVVERKGFSYHLTLGSPGDLEVSVLPYGVTAKTAQDAAFHPGRVQAFFDERPRLLDALSASSPGIPERLVLEPWSDILLELGIVRPHQLSPGGRP